jgi:MFS family permease
MRAIPGSTGHAYYRMRRPCARRLVVACLFVVNMLSMANRFAPSGGRTPIQRSLALSDVQVGVAQWLAVLSVAVLSPLVGALVATGCVRRDVALLCGGLLWTLSATGTAFVKTFEAYATMRTLCGAGDAAFSAVWQDIVVTIFAETERAAPFIAMTIAEVAGAAVGFAVGGAVADLASWRWTFASLGIPGVVAVVALYSSVRYTLGDSREAWAHLRRRGSTGQAGRCACFCRRRRCCGGATAASEASGAFDDGVILHTAIDTTGPAGTARARGARVCGGARACIASIPPRAVAILSGEVLVAFAIGGIVDWTPSVMSRYWSMTTAEAGAAFGLIGICTGVVGTVVGKFASDALRAVCLRKRLCGRTCARRLRTRCGASSVLIVSGVSVACSAMGFVACVFDAGSMSLPGPDHVVLPQERSMRLAVLSASLLLFSFHTSVMDAELSVSVPENAVSIAFSVRTALTHLIGDSVGPLAVAWAASAAPGGDGDIRLGLLLPVLAVLTAGATWAAAATASAAHTRFCGGSLALQRLRTLLESRRRDKRQRAARLRSQRGGGGGGGGACCCRCYFLCNCRHFCAACGAPDAGSGGGGAQGPGGRMLDTVRADTESFYPTATPSASGSASPQSSHLSTLDASSDGRGEPVLEQGSSSDRDSAKGAERAVG